MILDFPTSKPGEINVHCFSHPVYGILWQQPKLRLLETLNAKNTVHLLHCGAGELETPVPSFLPPVTCPEARAENALQSTSRHKDLALRRLAGSPKKWASSQPTHILGTEVRAEKKDQGSQAVLGDGGREEED